VPIYGKNICIITDILVESLLQFQQKIIKTKLVHTYLN